LASSTIFFHLSFSNANPTGHCWKFNLAEFLEASQHFRFCRVGLLAPCPTPTLEDQPSVFISPRGRVAQLYPPGIGYPFYSPLITLIGYGETILILQSPHGEHMKLVRVIITCLNETYSEVCIGKAFPIQNGLKQGDALLPLLLNFALKYAIALKQNFSRS
jgi:hypothetical protein